MQFEKIYQILIGQKFSTAAAGLVIDTLACLITLENFLKASQDDQNGTIRKGMEQDRKSLQWCMNDTDGQRIARWMTLMRQGQKTRIAAFEEIRAFTELAVKNSPIR